MTQRNCAMRSQAAETRQDGRSQVKDEIPCKFRAQGDRGWNGRESLRGSMHASSDSTVTEATSLTPDMDRDHGERIACNLYNSCQLNRN